MNKLLIFILVTLSATLTSCDAVYGIFKAGMGVGIFLVLAIAVLVIWFIARARR